MSFSLWTSRRLSRSPEGPKSRREHNNDLPTNVAAWIQINAKGEVTVFTGKTEVGQNISNVFDAGRHR